MIFEIYISILATIGILLKAYQLFGGRDD